MPALSIALDATASQLAQLEPRQLQLETLATRQPSIDYQYDPKLASRSLAARQSLIQTGIIPTYYNFDGPAPGLVVGIVLGSVAGFLLIVWIIYSLTQLNNSSGTTHTIRGEEEIVVRRRRGSQGASNRSRRSTRTEVRDYSSSPVRQVIVEERRRTTRPRSIVVEDRRVPGDDVIEVTEEHDYPPRRSARRSGGYR